MGPAQSYSFTSVPSYIRFPDQVFIFGGGRWARVIARVARDILPTNIPLTLCSPRGASGLSEWALEQGLDDVITVSDKWPETFPRGRNAVIVANAARDHVAAGNWALERGAAVLIEKPLTMSLRDTQGLVDCARRCGSLLASAHVLRFARYFKTFSSMLPEWGHVTCINLEWVDPAGEWRYGETKQYDSSVPVFVDCLPHVISALQSVFGLLPELAGPPAVEDGGSKVILSLVLCGRPCRVYLQRNGTDRIRRMSVKTLNESLILDFSAEPGVVWRGSQSICADPCWDDANRPLASLLCAFLMASAGGSVDSRLSLDTALTACAITDAVMPDYRAAVLSWLTNHLSLGNELSDAVHYALIEVLQIDRHIFRLELESIEFLLQKLLHKEDLAGKQFSLNDRY